jgi:hypothetical protein
MNHHWLLAFGVALTGIIGNNGELLGVVPAAFMCDKDVFVVIVVSMMNVNFMNNLTNQK